MKPFLAVLALSLVPLAACQTTPEPCTQEWVDYKSDRILRPFALENRGLIDDLRALADADGDIDALATVRLFSRKDELQDFADSFQNSVVPELKLALQECSQDEAFIPALTGFLRDEGVNEEALRWVAPIIGLMQEMREDVGNAPQQM